MVVRPDEDSLTLLTLHGLRLGGVVGAEDVARRWDLDVDAVDAELRGARARRWVTRREGVLPGWALSATGRREGERLLSAELDRAGARPIAEDRYRHFLPLNRQFLQLCTDWQVRRVEGVSVVNDHTDPVHDRQVLSRLAEVHAEIGEVLGPLAARLRRFAGYVGRLDHAHRRVVAGDVDWFTQPLVDSYHTVWFELHEDLLATLGRARTDEAGH